MGEEIEEVQEEVAGAEEIPRGLDVSRISRQVAYQQDSIKDIIENRSLIDSFLELKADLCLSMMFDNFDIDEFNELEISEQASVIKKMAEVKKALKGKADVEVNFNQNNSLSKEEMERFFGIERSEQVIDISAGGEATPDEQ